MRCTSITGFGALRVRETSTNYQDDLDLKKWLGVRDDFRNWLCRAA
jgi:hypothetical protein